MAVYKKHKGKRIDSRSPYYRKASWYAEGSIQGVRYHISLKKFGVKSREEAEIKEDLIIAEIRQGEFDVARRKTGFADFIDKIYLPVARLKNPSFKTKVFQTNKLKEFFGNVPLKNITSARCELYKAWRLKQKKVCQGCLNKKHTSCSIGNVGASTVNRELTTLSAIFTLAVREREIKENPMRFVRVLAEPPPRDRLLSEDEKVRLLNALQSHKKMLSLVLITLLTGWRKDQILHLKKTDLDANYKAVWIKASKRAPARKQAVSEFTWQILSYLAENAFSEWLFANRLTGERLKDFSGTWKRVLKKAEIEDFLFKDLRHVFATSLLQGGADMRIIQTAMSHQRIKTSEIYAQVTNSALLSSLETVADDKLLKDSFRK